MRIAYLDCFSGISGDMFLGALIDAGVPSQIFEQAVEALAVGARLQITRANRSGISATKVTVIVNENHSAGSKRGSSGHSHSHHHAHDHSDTHSHEHAHRDSLANHEHVHSRGLNEIREII